MLHLQPLPAGTDLPALHRRAPARYPLLMQSVAHGTAQGCWDLLLATDGSGLRLDADGLVRDMDGRVHDGGFLQALDARWRQAHVPAADTRWPFRGGWALLLDYELAAQVEPVLALPMPAPGARPLALALRCPAAILRNRADGRCVALAESGHAGLLQALAADLAAPATPPAAWTGPEAIAEDPPQRFIQGVERILDYLRAGDVFQVNLSRGWHARFATAPDPAALYARMCAASPAPFAGLFAGDGWAVASASPERLVAVRGRTVETRPIAGTRARFPGDDDAARIRELVGHPKERAEHVMLIDLERNDLGRVCTPGSVHVDELMTVESYAHVHHIVSNVRGTLRPDATPGEVIAAVFPGGTITGCPKVRCMQVIAELERAPRGAYTGAFGWLGRDGDMDLNILIRSAELRGRELAFRTGAGIVVDSEPERELEETRAKARGLLRALDPRAGGVS